ncbi:hypothetical protein BH10PSE12_BH10PSE12_16920 [soil metagenome]
MAPLRDRRTLFLRFIRLAGYTAMATHAPNAHAQEDHSGLTRAKFRRDCLMCHSKAAPEGISPEIMAGLHPVPGLKPAVAMPTLICWRRCEKCFPKAPSEEK